MKTIILSLLISTTLWANYSLKTLDKAMNEVDGWCMDTYCAGDFNYHSPILKQLPNSGTFILMMKAEGWYGQGEGFINKIKTEASELKLVLENSKKYPLIAKYKPDWSDLIIADSMKVHIEKLSLEASYWGELGKEPVYKFNCRFDFPKETLKLKDLTEEIYYATLDCVNAFEANL